MLSTSPTTNLVNHDEPPLGESERLSDFSVDLPPQSINLNQIMLSTKLKTGTRLGVVSIISAQNMSVSPRQSGVTG